MKQCRTGSHWCQRVLASFHSRPAVAGWRQIVVALHLLSWPKQQPHKEFITSRRENEFVRCLITPSVALIRIVGALSISKSKISCVYGWLHFRNVSATIAELPFHTFLILNQRSPTIKVKSHISQQLIDSFGTLQDIGRRYTAPKIQIRTDAFRAKANNSIALITLPEKILKMTQHFKHTNELTWLNHSDR